MLKGRYEEKEDDGEERGGKVVDEKAVSDEAEEEFEASLIRDEAYEDDVEAKDSTREGILGGEEVTGGEVVGFFLAVE